MELLIFMGKVLFATLLYLTAIQLSIKLHNYLKQKRKRSKKDENNI